ncbi:hypothetical protein M758_7G028500 [Ceratodon purpureus]|nr:hypothetical protein M758_7G028500 [Ceratodon purpureus]
MAPEHCHGAWTLDLTYSSPLQKPRTSSLPYPCPKHAPHRLKGGGDFSFPNWLLECSKTPTHLKLMFMFTSHPLCVQSSACDINQLSCYCTGPSCESIVPEPGLQVSKVL